MENRPSLLVVEDEEITAKLLDALFAKQGWNVERVLSAEEALPVLDSRSFDVILLDKNLPGMSGLELLARIKSTTPDVEVILMTAFADMPSVLRAVAAGVYDYLLKPFDALEGVLHTVGRALEKRRLYQENHRLIAELRVSNERLERLNNELESMVAERTAQLEQLSLTDDVTGLYNQRFLFNRLEEELHRAERYNRTLSVMMLDIDFFKRVNDNHDHLFGSRVLKNLGAILCAQVRAVDMVVRYGGDEFVVILPETPASGAAIAAERIRAKIEQSDVGEPSQPYRLTVSIGLASWRDSAAGDAQALLRAADRALYAAKENGRNCIFATRGEKPELVRS